MQNGELIVVRYGQKGEQLASYLGWLGGYKHRVEKWIRNGQRWTKPVPVVSSEILRRATPEDITRFQLPFITDPSETRRA